MKCEIENTFTLTEMNTEEMEKHIGTWNSKKALQYCDIPTRTIKENWNVVSNFLYAAINSSKKSLFQHFLKQIMLYLSIKRRKDL